MLINRYYQYSLSLNMHVASLAGTTLVADRFTYPATATRFQNTTWIMNARFDELLDSNIVPATHFAIQKAVVKRIPKPKCKNWKHCR